jgi:predicted type IV restriction endonuclease
VISGLTHNQIGDKIRHVAAPAVIVNLVKHFARNADAYRHSLNETEVRVQFVDPFFEALGWDIHNKHHYAETYKDVLHEYSLRTSTHTTAPDYCFQVGGTRKFFVEAKRPSVNISADPAPAYQLRTYAWTSKLPLSLLTNFAEFAVYDGRSLPLADDKSDVARVDLITFDQYTDKWDDIVARFSREAVCQGSFDRYIESSKLKKGTAEVDEVFLSDIESWRKELASNIAARNPSLTQRDVNMAVQGTIDRIIFLRICEDRGIEKYGQLQELLRNEHIYRHLCTIYQRADEKYNSGLFHFTDETNRSEPRDELTLSLKIDDERLKPILKRLYYPEGPYQFSYFPAEVLGPVYEQFLGQVIRLTAGHQAKVEPKPEVKKAGGVYYTPIYIVEYIVRNTIGKLIEGKTPKQVAKLRILDPACGSGSFLLGAYGYLLNWHRDWYLADGAANHKKVLFQTQGGTWHLTTSEKKRILLNNIYGVDIDSQAVEVTKLSLFA